MKTQKTKRKSEQGNILFIILIAIVLIGALTAAIQSGSNEDSAHIDDETLIIRASEVQRQAAEMERAILFIQQNGVSESDIRFAHPDQAASTDYGDISADSDKSDQVFHSDGGAANYPEIPNGIQSTAGQWEFFGGTHLPGVGSDRADLIALLPDVTLQFCQKINEINKQTSAQPNDTSTCLKLPNTDRYGNTGSFNDSSTNTVDEGSFTEVPALQACVQCGSTYHFYHVLLAR